ncbi:MAG TPA: 1-(5-phosphoribosyl)-5-[(5-phosphoribosylamino)methylideneamino]imidazole-4-carboxamide isomerase [Blastocatellia bacterium]|nr:1-(5-phosphoribosyl)-5-[(5-phosphoribosylamino)methylideneamino]imidazole-4-carboxamide isomerase [Blastocatellia bacterium]
MEIYVAIDILGGRVVRLRQGDPSQMTVYGDDPLAMAVRWAREGAGALHVVDLDAALSRGSQREVVVKIAQKVKIPVQVGGGLRREEDVCELLDRGVSRVVLGTLAFRHEDVLCRLLERYDRDRIVVALDGARERVLIEGWTRETGIAIEHAVRHFAALGVRHFLVTAVDRDGTLAGPDFDLLGRLATVPDIHLIASGGIGHIGDISELQRIGVKGVVVGRAVYEGQIRLAELRAFTSHAGSN